MVCNGLLPTTRVYFINTTIAVTLEDHCLFIKFNELLYEFGADHIYIEETAVSPYSTRDLWPFYCVKA